LKRGGAAPADHNPRSGLDHGAGDTLSDSGASTRHNHRLAGQIEHSQPPF
jgi:hypothetical protein